MEFITALDIEILWRIQNLFHSALMDRLMIFFTALGDHGMIWAAMALPFLILRRTRRMAFAMLAAMLVGYVLTSFGLKPYFARIRPFEVDTSIKLLITPPADFSFPSVHAMNSFAAAYALGHYNKRLGGYAIVLAGIIAFSRLYLMVHYPTDVFAGIVVGLVSAWLTCVLIDRIFPVRYPQNKK
jgi:undecaprenyl-diphosphatase